MTENGWTPGPWSLSDEVVRDGLRSRLLHGQPDGMLAIIRTEHQGRHYGSANARLIAAAPCMAKALADAEALLNAIEQCGVDLPLGPEDDIPATRARMLAALSRARGEG